MNHAPTVACPILAAGKCTTGLAGGQDRALSAPRSRFWVMVQENVDDPQTERLWGLLPRKATGYMTNLVHGRADTSSPVMA